MKKRCLGAKVFLSVIATVLLLCTLFSVTAAADNVANYNRAYGQVVPTDSNLKKQVENYNFYGNSGTLYFMQISKGKENANFAVEIFADSSYKNQVRRFTRPFPEAAGNTPLKVSWEFKDIASGTYYGRCYTYVETVSNGQKTVTIDSSSYNKFTIKINRVGKEKVVLSTLVNTTSGPKLTWKTLPTAIKYNVYRKASGAKSWTYITTLNGQVSTYTDKTAKSGVTYSYTVKCSDGKYVSLYDTKGLSIKCLSTPKISVAGYGSAGNAKISWNAVPGASGYYIYRKGGSLSNDSWTQIAKVTNGKATYYVDTTAKSTDWVYTYTVKAFSGKYVSAFNYNGVDFDYIKAPSIKRVSSYVDPKDNKSGMKIEWSAGNKNTAGYYVYRKNGNTWKYLGKTTDKVFIDKTAPSGKMCTYTVKAYSAHNAGAYNAKGVTNKYLAAPTLSNITFTYSYGSVVKWNKIPGAAGYVVYRKVNNAKAWTTVTTIKNGDTTTFTDNCKKASGNTYTYTVRAIDSNGRYGYFKAGVSSVCLAKPFFSVAQMTTEDNSLAIEVKWPEINGATKYLVYKRLPGKTWACQTMVDGKAQYITDTQYIDKKVEHGVTYEYAVRAFNNDDDYSSFYTKKAYAVNIPTVKDVVIVKNGEQIGSKITWTAQKNAQSYNIFRLAHGETEWKKIDTVKKDTTYLDASEGASEKRYYYAVTAVYTKTESAKSAPVANFADVTLKAELVKGEKGKHILLSWNCKNEKTVTLYKGTSKEELVSMGTNNGGVSYSVPDTAVFPGNTYTYKIVVTAENKVNGEATVTIKYPHNPLAQTTITEVAPSSLDGVPMVKITWNKVQFAENYIILRSEDGKKWKEAGKVTADTNSAEPTVSFVDKNIEAEKTYYYKIKSTAPKAERPESTSKSSEAIKLLTPIGSIRDLIAVERLEGDKVFVDISWAATDYADGYVISRTTNPKDENSWKILGTRPDKDNPTGEDGTISTTFTDSTITSNGKYYYKIIAVSEEDRGTSQNTCNIEISFFTEKKTK